VTPRVSASVWRQSVDVASLWMSVLRRLGDRQRVPLRDIQPARPVAPPRQEPRRHLNLCPGGARTLLHGDGAVRAMIWAPLGAYSPGRSSLDVSESGPGWVALAHDNACFQLLCIMLVHTTTNFLRVAPHQLHN
jgi:hypothetical protein